MSLVNYKAKNVYFKFQDLNNIFSKKFKILKATKKMNLQTDKFNLKQIKTKKANWK